MSYIGKSVAVVLSAWVLSPGWGAVSDIDALVGRMTLREKVGQLNQLVVFGDTLGSVDGWRENIRRGEVSSFIWGVSDPKFRNELQRLAVEESRLGIPLVFGMDIIHGCNLVFPIAPALAGSFEPDLFEKAQTVAALEARAEGVDWVFAPMCDTARDPRWGRVQETCGEDPYLNALCCAAQVRGFQGSDPSAPDRVVACLKHYVGYSSVTGGRDYNDAEISEWQLRNLHLRPFRAAVEDAGALTVMSSFNALDGIPAVANRHALADILRGEWGFGGFVVSDWEAVGELCEWGIARDRRDAAAMAVLAGCDMDMKSECYVGGLEAAVSAGAVPVAVVDEAVLRVLRVKAAAGLFERPYADEGAKDRVWPASRASNAALARECVRKSAVLLKNEGEALPLDADRVRSVAVIGPFGDDAVEMGGAWKGRFDSSSCVTLADGLRIAMPDAEIAVVNEMADAKEAARRADAVIVTIGEPADMTGENQSRATLDATGGQMELFRAAVSVGKPVVALVFAGRPLALNEVYDKASAVLYCWQPGSEAGNGLADLLLGKESPSARLTMSIPWSVGEVPCFYNQPVTGRPRQGEYKDVPLRKSRYPFGYGLTYSMFAYSDLRIEGDVVKATLKNTGQREATETAQLYIHQIACREGWRPVRELRGFKRVTLRPGETADVSFRLTDEVLGYTRRDGRRACDAGEYGVWIAPDSRADGVKGISWYPHVMR